MKSRIAFVLSDPYIVKIIATIKIVKVVKGQAALDGIRKAFFGDDKVQADKWQKKLKWSSRDIAESIFFIYERKLRKNTEKVCKFVIGRKGDGSVLGQVI